MVGCPKREGSSYLFIPHDIPIATAQIITITGWILNFDTYQVGYISHHIPLATLSLFESHCHR